MTYASTVQATSGLVWYSRMGDASSPAVDLINANNAAQVNSPTFGATGLISGDSDKAVSFASASSQYLKITYAAPLNVGDVFSLEAWIKLTSIPGYMNIIAQDGSSYLFLVTNTGHLELWRGDIAAIVSSTNTLSSGTIYHVVVTKNGATVKLYVNGTDVSGTVTNQTEVNNSADVWIAGRVGFAQYVNGVIDEVAIYNAAMSAADVLAHYNAGSAAAAGLPFFMQQDLRNSGMLSLAGGMQ